MLVDIFMRKFSTGLQEKFGLEVIINGNQFLLKKEDGRYYKYPLHKDGNSYLKTKTSAIGDNVEKIMKVRITKVTPFSQFMGKNILAFQELEKFMEFV